MSFSLEELREQFVYCLAMINAEVSVALPMAYVHREGVRLEAREHVFISSVISHRKHEFRGSMLLEKPGRELTLVCPGGFDFHNFLAVHGPRISIGEQVLKQCKQFFCQPGAELGLDSTIVPNEGEFFFFNKTAWGAVHKMGQNGPDL